MFSSAPGRTQGHTAFTNSLVSTDIGLKVGRLFWEQDIGRFDSYISDGLDLSCPHIRIKCRTQCGMAQLGSATGS